MKGICFSFMSEGNTWKIKLTRVYERSLIITEAHADAKGFLFSENRSNSGLQFRVFLYLMISAFPDTKVWQLYYIFCCCCICSKSSKISSLGTSTKSILYSMRCQTFTFFQYSLALSHEMNRCHSLYSKSGSSNSNKHWDSLHLLMWDFV